MNNWNPAPLSIAILNGNLEIKLTYVVFYFEGVISE